MRKQILLLALLVMTAATAVAGVTMRVQLASGEESVFQLDDNPEVAFLSGKLRIATAEEQPVLFEIDEVAAIDFLGKSGVDDEAAEAVGGITVTVSGGLVTFGNIPAGSRVEVYDTAGALVASTEATDSHTISRSELPAGVYIVKINKFVTKVTL